MYVWMNWMKINGEHAPMLRRSNGQQQQGTDKTPERGKLAFGKESQASRWLLPRPA
jgi:hypothetical protein